MKLFITVPVIACALAATASAQNCTPFGDPPRPLVPDDTVQLTCAGGTMMAPWDDSNGTTRQACLYEPVSASSARPLPLIVFIHGSLVTADSLWVTNILDYQDTADVSGDPARPGFIVVAPEGRPTTHFYPPPDAQGMGWDNWYRQLDPRVADVVVDGVTYPQNVDAAAIDHFIDEVVATGKVDTSRIYISGWSNGSAMALLYALNRPRIAAAAVYSAPNPFEAFNDPCPQQPVAHTAQSDAELQLADSLPILHIHNACDVFGICPNCELLREQLTNVHAPFTDVIIDGSQQQVPACNPGCGTNPLGAMSFQDDPRGYAEGALNHIRWPTLWTQSMLDFFRQHPGA